mgnify:CR=1 FL=1
MVPEDGSNNGPHTGSKPECLERVRVLGLDGWISPPFPPFVSDDVTISGTFGVDPVWIDGPWGKMGRSMVPIGGRVDLWSPPQRTLGSNGWIDGPR